MITLSCQVTPLLEYRWRHLHSKWRHFRTKWRHFKVQVAPPSFQVAPLQNVDGATWNAGGVTSERKWRHMEGGATTVPTAVVDLYALTIVLARIFRKSLFNSRSPATAERCFNASASENFLCTWKKHIRPKVLYKTECHPKCSSTFVSFKSLSFSV